VIEEYAVAGALALVFWTEPVPTYDLDVLVFLPPSVGSVVSLGLEQLGVCEHDAKLIVQPVEERLQVWVR